MTGNYKARRERGITPVFFNGVSQDYEILHNLGYMPGYYDCIALDTTDAALLNYSFTVDATKIYLHFNNIPGAAVVNYSWEVIKDQFSFVYPWGTGGTVTTDGDYRIHTFTSSGTFNLIVPGQAPYNTATSLIVAGGGGGGGVNSSNSTGGGGGGAGQVTPHLVNLFVQLYNVVIGSGGFGGAVTGVIPGSNGGNSTFDGITAIGGGYGGQGFVPGNSGGNGGGSNWAGPGIVVPGGIGIQFNGGDSSPGAVNYGSAGGAGAGQAGFTNTTVEGGKGGSGIQSNISGALIYYGGGGAGGTGIDGSNVHFVPGGQGGGGSSFYGSGGLFPGGPGSDGFGGGGGGGSYNGQGGDGGTGVVIIRYKYQ